MLTKAKRADDWHGNFAHLDQPDDARGYGRFVYVFHSPIEEPDDSLFKTTPHAQLDFQVCGNKIGNYTIPSLDPGHICKVYG
jgi:hypothetical protein